MSCRAGVSASILSIIRSTQPMNSIHRQTPVSAVDGKPRMTDNAFFSRRHFIQSLAAAGATLSLPAILPSPVSGANVPVASARPRPQVVAIYCPLWHRYNHMDAWRGYGWNEWELLKTAPPRFPGHYQPLRPSWGCFDESDPQWVSRRDCIGRRPQHRRFPVRLVLVFRRPAHGGSAGEGLPQGPQP